MSEPWTEEREAEALTRCEAASSPPWRSWGPYALESGLREGPLDLEGDDGEFIIHARVDLPDAIAEIQRLRGELGELKAEFSIDHAELVTLRDKIARSGCDESLCMVCGEPVLCIPDGMPMCEPCARMGENNQ